jgi:hypothetical protein
MFVTVFLVKDLHRVFRQILRKLQMMWPGGIFHEWLSNGLVMGRRLQEETSGDL